MTKTYIVKGRLVAFDILQECKLKTGEPCYLAVVKGTEQTAWLYNDAIEFWTHKGNVVISAIPHMTIIK